MTRARVGIANTSAETKKIFGDPAGLGRCDLASRSGRAETLEVPVLPARRGKPDLVILASHA